MNYFKTLKLVLFCHITYNLYCCCEPCCNFNTKKGSDNNIYTTSGEPTHKNICKYNQDVFNDTIRQCENDPQIKKIVEKTEENQEYIKEDDTTYEIHYEKAVDHHEVVIEDKKVIESAIYNLSKNKGKRVAILNFANWLTPGGGVKSGCTQQEETICRCTTLYPCINANNVKSFYKDHKNIINTHTGDSIKANNDIIYSTGVYILKDDKISNNIEKLEFDPNRVVDVITCAAPDNSNKKLTDDEISKIHEVKISKIIKVSEKKKVDILILGAHGCGVFSNNPIAVAKAYKKVLDCVIKKSNISKFVFAIPILNGDKTNYDSFKGILNELINK